MFFLATRRLTALSFSLLAATGWAATPLTVEDAVRTALERNPSLLALRSEVEVARARLAGASRILQDNPELAGGVGARQTPIGASVELEVGLSQRIELFGQRSARQGAAQAVLELSLARQQQEELVVAAQVREAFGRALAAELQLKLNEAGRAVALSSVKAAEERFAAGGATRMEVNTARVEIGRATRELALAQQRRVQLQSDLAILTGVSTSDLTLSGTLETASVGDEQEEGLVARALEQRPDVKAARAETEAAQAEQRLAFREVLPSPRLGVSYAREEAANVVLGTLSFELPVFNQNQAARGAAAARVTQAEQALTARLHLVKVEVGLALSRYRAASVAAGAYAGDVLKAMDDNTQLVTEAYRAGKVDFLELLIIQRQSLEARRGYIETLEELNAAAAQLKRVTGRIQ